MIINEEELDEQLEIEESLEEEKPSRLKSKKSGK